MTSVVVIATYLTFFPVTIAMIRGLRSPDPRALELMRSYAAGRWATYRKLRLPASLPYLFTALKIAATASIVGAIIGEGPGGIPDGLGRAIINFNQQYITGPEKLWAAILVRVAAGRDVLRADPRRSSSSRCAAGPARRKDDRGWTEPPTALGRIGRPGRPHRRRRQGLHQRRPRSRPRSRASTSRSGAASSSRSSGRRAAASRPCCGSSATSWRRPRGTVEVNGKPAARARLDRDYGMVFQAPVLFDWRSVEDNVKLPLELMGYDGARRTARAKEMLDLVELSDFPDHHPYQLSGGMQQRVAIARALAFEPSILLMDEPFGALDEMTRERMNQEVLRIWEQTGITVVFVTHSIPEAVFLSSRVVVMSARPGRITDVIEVDLPRPRGVETREERRYFELVTAVREALRRGDGDATRAAADGGPRPTPGLARPGEGRGRDRVTRHAARSRAGRRARRAGRSLAAADRLLPAGDRRLRR